MSFSIPVHNKRSSQEFSKNILQNITMKDQKENKNPMRSLSPFLTKTPRSRSGSPDKGKINTSFGTLNSSRVEIGNTNIYPKPTNMKCTINKLGLNLRPFCNNKDHKRSNISHICIADQCQDESINVPRLGCQYCVLEKHSSHKEACIPIEQFSDYIDSQFQSVTSSFKDLNQQCLKLDNPPFLSKIYDSLNMLKLAVCHHIDNQKQQVKQQIAERAEEFLPNHQERMENYSVLQNKFKMISQKKLFELSEQEIDVLLKFSKQEFVDEMNSFRKKLLNTFNLIEYQTELASNHYHSSIQNLVQCILKNHEQLYMPLKKDVMSMPGNSKIKFQKLQFFVLQRKQEEIFKSLKELKILMGDEQTSNQSINNPTQLTAQDIQQGKLLIYNDQCKHSKQSSIQCNTVPIFGCCKQTYQCVKCHNSHTIHKAVITEPSQRMCLKCLSIFTVEYATDVPINCNSCLDTKLLFQDNMASNLMQSIFTEDLKQNNRQQQSQRSHSPQLNQYKRSASPLDQKRSISPIEQQRSASPALSSQYQSKSRAKSAKDEKFILHNNNQNIQTSAKKQNYSTKKEGKQ